MSDAVIDSAPRAVPPVQHPADQPGEQPRLDPAGQPIITAETWKPPRSRIAGRYPILFPLAVEYHRMRRRIRWLTDGTRWATTQADPLPVRVLRHNSLLLRTLGESEMWMQHNKVKNLKLASPRIDGLVLRPGETFSFCRRVGKTSKRRGYVEGMLLENGKAHPGVGGGICQIANLLHWMALHSPLTVVARSTHGFDPFPDSGRVLPWGVGAAIYYNYVDLQFRNDTDTTFQLMVKVGEKYLHGELRADQMPAHSYKVKARDEHFETDGERWFRTNEIWRDVIDRRTGNTIEEQFIKRNFGLVMYTPDDVGRAHRGDQPTTPDPAVTCLAPADAVEEQAGPPVTG